MDVPAAKVNGYLDEREVALTCEVHGFLQSTNPPVWQGQDGSIIDLHQNISSHLVYMFRILISYASHLKRWHCIKVLENIIFCTSYVQTVLGQQFRGLLPPINIGDAFKTSDPVVPAPLSGKGIWRDHRPDGAPGGCAAATATTLRV